MHEVSQPDHARHRVACGIDVTNNTIVDAAQREQGTRSGDRTVRVIGDDDDIGRDVPAEFF
jgi:hypothetical protein